MKNYPKGRTIFSGTIGDILAKTIAAILCAAVFYGITKLITIIFYS